MEITLEKINERYDPYQLFLDGIKNKETARRYKNLLYTFLKLIPNQIYQDILNESPKNKEVETLAEFFVNLARKDPEITSNVIATYIKEDKKRADDKRTKIDKDDIPDILERFKNRRKEDNSDRKKKHFSVPIKEIKDNNYDLSISKYQKIELVKVQYEKSEIVKKKILKLEKNIIETLNKIPTNFDK